MFVVCFLCVNVVCVSCFFLILCFFFFYFLYFFIFFFFQAEDGIRDLVRSRGLGDVYKRQLYKLAILLQKRRSARQYPEKMRGDLNRVQ